jgi:hypothetical protein
MPIPLALGVGKIAFDFNPTVDRIRVESTNRSNFRLDPNNGSLTATDGLLTYATGDPNSARSPGIAAVAYTNSFAGSTATALYAYDQNFNVLALQNPPNDGTLNTLGSSGLAVNIATPNLDMDIYSPSAGQNTPYLVATTGTSSTSVLYTVNLTNGTATQVGTIGNGITVSNIAVAGPSGVSANRDRSDVAAAVSLFPNPAAGSSTLRFVLPRAGRVALTVFDAMGREVAAPAPQQLPAGAQTLRWEAQGARAGLYFVRLTVDGEVAATRQLLLTE